MDTNVKFEALEVLNFLYESKKSRSWLRQSAVNDGVQMEMQTLANGISTMSNYSVQIKALDVVFQYFKLLSKSKLNAGQVVGILENLPDPLESAFKNPSSGVELLGHGETKY
jgi:hypothetical protein